MKKKQYQHRLTKRFDYDDFNDFHHKDLNRFMQNPSMQICPCNPQNLLTTCCGIYHAGEPARNAEKLMRSRYSAYALGLIDYLVATTLPAQQQRLDQEGIRTWSTQSIWLGLEVKNFEEFVDKIHATVTFVAKWKDAQGEHQHLEKSGFVKIKDRWYFLDPTAPLNLGRNDPCPCGNGAKFKKCCSTWIA